MDETSRLAWEVYRRRQRRYLVVTLAGFAAAGVLCMFAAVFDRWDILTLVLLTLAPIWLVLTFIAWWQIWFFQCLRCHQPFHASDHWSKSCRHCGLRPGESKVEPAPLGWHNPGKFEWPSPTKTPAE